MTSISSLPGMATATSPRPQMDARTTAGASAGDISSTDQKAPLDTTDSSPSTANAATGGKGDMKERIDSLIETQVDAGSLSDGEAAELKAFFAPGTPANGDAPAAGGRDTSRRPEAAGGPPPPPRAAQTAGGVSPAGSDTATSGTSIEDQLKALEAMLDNLRQGLSVTSNAYGAASSASVAPTGLVYRTVA